MCAINGIINFEGIEFEDKSKIEMSLKNMEYRGPDYSGCFQNSRIVFGHNRLSILDLNLRSNQPMLDESNRFVIVFNGEIYNYLDLKRELEIEGVTFNSKSDTEVLLKGLIKHNKAFISKIRGMFSFVFWDIFNQKGLFVRDRFGEKPFYYSYKNRRIVFASNLSGIMPLLDIEPKINKQAVYELLSQQYIDDSECIYEGIHKLYPGNYIEISSDNLSVNQYWSPNYSNKISDSYEESKEKIHQIIKSSVEEQLEADVPVGLFLSGGTDSSIIAAIASIYKKEVTAITMAVPNNSSANEATAAAFVAKKLAINHKIVPIDENCVDKLPSILKTIEPLADASLIPSLAIANEAKKDFKVMLSGDGGDEIFGGYTRPVIFNSVKNKNKVYTKKVLDVIVNNNFYPFNKLSEKLNDKRIFEFAGLKKYYETLNLNDAIVKKIIVSNNIANKNVLHYNNAKDYTIEESDKLLYVGIKSKLPADFLFKMDAANMFNSVESRVPFLDYRLLEYTSQLSVNQLMPNGVDKQMLKDIGSNYLPKEFFEQPKKGFSIPYYEYLKKSWGDLILKFCYEGISSDLEILDSKEVIKLVMVYRKKPSFKIGKILYSILVFEIWLRVFHMKQSPSNIIIGKNG
jgi:asparagine synthase (glutamine-hydrolysing)